MSFDLERALEDLAEAGASRRSADDDALTTRVGIMAARIRRRRAARYAGTTVVAVCAVGALALGVTYLPGLLGDGSTGPAAPSSSAPGPTATLAPLSVANVCGVPMSELAASGQLDSFLPAEASSAPQTDDAGFTEVLAATEIPDGVAAEVAHTAPDGARLLEVGWSVLLVDADGVVVGFQPTPRDGVTAPDGVPSTGLHMNLAMSSCETGDPLPAGAYDLYAVAEAHGVLASGSPYVERTTSPAFPVELADTEEETPGTADPVAEVFACNAPGPESIHTLPDPGGLTLAVDLPEGPWAAENIPEVPATIGASGGQTILANLGQGVNLALVDDDGIVVGVVRADSGDVDLFEIEPTKPVETQTPQLLVTCGPEGEDQYEQPLAGTFTAWPYVTAVLKEVTDAEGNATTPSSDPVIVIANPQDVTFAG